MKKMVFLSMILFLLFGAQTAQAQGGKKSEASTVKKADVEVYYFHYTRRCLTCNAVEDVARKSLQELYPEQVKAGKITFASLNLDDKKDKSLAKKLKVNDQGLWVIKGGKKVDLTDTGFMNARSKPDKFKSEIKKTVDSMM